MIERTVLFGTYDEIKKWYDDLELAQIDNLKAEYLEFMPFERQINPDDIGKVQIIGRYRQEQDDKGDFILKLEVVEVCIINEAKDLIEEK
jgi:hypothetical protein